MISSLCQSEYAKITIDGYLVGGITDFSVNECTDFTTNHSYSEKGPWQLNKKATCYSIDIERILLDISPVKNYINWNIAFSHLVQIQLSNNIYTFNDCLLKEHTVSSDANGQLIEKLEFMSFSMK